MTASIVLKRVPDRQELLATSEEDSAVRDRKRDDLVRSNQGKDASLAARRLDSKSLDVAPIERAITNTLVDDQSVRGRSHTDTKGEPAGGSKDQGPDDRSDLSVLTRHGKRDAKRQSEGDQSPRRCSAKARGGPIYELTFNAHDTILPVTTSQLRDWCDHGTVMS